MDFREFHDFHMPVLLANEVRHSILVAMLTDARESEGRDLQTWTLGAPGCCAAKAAGRGIVLGDLNRAQCAVLAEKTVELDFPAVLGPDMTAKWFVARSAELGLTYEDPIPQRIYALGAPPKYPDSPGRAREVGAEDAGIFVDWVTAFHREAVPHDPVPPRAAIENWIGQRRHLFWTVDGEPVSLAGIQRRTPNAAAIAAVYTPPDLRGRGYAGCATAAVVDRIRAEGRKTACLYTDLRNAYANRCYTAIGFEPVCESRFILRRTDA